MTWMTDEHDPAVQYRRELREQAGRNEQARKDNIATFTRMFLTLGPDATKLTGTNHDSELVEARSLAGHRWSVLIDQEAQLLKDKAALAARPAKRPSEPRDDTTPDRTIQKWEAAYVEETARRKADLANLEQQLKNERKALESLRIDYRKEK